MTAVKGSIVQVRTWVLILGTALVTAVVDWPKFPSLPPQRLGWRLAKFSRHAEAQRYLPNQRYIASYTGSSLVVIPRSTNVFSSRQTVKSGKLTAWAWGVQLLAWMARQQHLGKGRTITSTSCLKREGVPEGARSVNPSPTLRSTPSTTPVTPTTPVPDPTKTTVPPASPPGSPSTPTGAQRLNSLRVPAGHLAHHMRPHRPQGLTYQFPFSPTSVSIE